MRKIGAIFGAHTVSLKVTRPVTLIIMQNLVFADFTIKMSVEAPVYFSIVLGLKSNKSN